MARLRAAPREMRDPKWGDMLRNGVSQLAANLVHFTAPTAAAALVNEHLDLSPEKESLVYAAMITISTIVGQDVDSIVGRKIGGATANLRFNLGNHANHGPYLQIASKLATVLSNVLYHGATHVGLTAAAPEFFNSTPYGQGLRALGSGAAMSAVGQLVNTLGAKYTLKRNNVESVDELPVPEGSREIKNGIYFNSIPAREERATVEFKRIEVAGVTLQRLFGSVGLALLTMEARRAETDLASGRAMPKHSPVAQSLLTIMGAYSAFFIIGAIVETAFTRFATDPRIYVNRNGRSSHQAAGELIKASGMNAMERLLNRIGVGFETKSPDAFGDRPEMRQAQELYFSSVKVLSGEAMRESAAVRKPTNAVNPWHAQQSAIAAQTQTLQAVPGHATPLGGSSSGSESDVPSDKPSLPYLDDVNKLCEFFKEIKTTVEQPRANAPEQSHDGTLREIGDWIDHLMLSLRILTLNGERSGTLNPNLNDLKFRVRGMQALLAKSVFRADGAENAIQDDRLMQVAKALIPVFSGLRKADRMAGVADFFKGVSEFTQGRADAKSVLSVMTAQGHDRLLVRDIAIHVRRMGNAQVQLDNLRTLFDSAFDGRPPTKVNCKLLLLEQALEEIDRAEKNMPAKTDDVRNALLNRTMLAFRRLSDDSPVALLRDAGESFVVALKEGDFNLKDLADELARLKRTAAPLMSQDSAIEKTVKNLLGVTHPPGRPTAVEDGTIHTLRHFTHMMGQDFVDAVAEEAHPTQDGEAFNEQLLRNMEQDIRSWPQSHRDLTVYSLKELESYGPLSGVPKTPAKDFHKHHTTYSGSKGNVEVQGLHDDEQNILDSLYSAIPSQVWGIKWNGKYYTNTEFMMSYADNDGGIAFQDRQRRNPDRPVIALNEVVDLIESWDEVKKGEKPRLIMGRWESVRPSAGIRNGITAVDPTDPTSVRRAILDAIRKYPDVPFDGLGETTIMKEGVREVNARAFVVDGQASRTLQLECAYAGLFLLAHCDAGDAWDKLRYFDKWSSVTLNTARTLKNSPHMDPLRSEPGNEMLPPPKLILVDAHFKGGARFTNFSNDHTRKVHDFLHHPELKDQQHVRVYIDASWDYCMHQVWQNCSKLLELPDASQHVQRKLMPVRKGLDLLLKSYQTFAEEGSRGDYSSDASMPNSGMVHVIAANDAAKSHFEVLRDVYLPSIKEAVADDQTRQHLVDLCEVHGDRGNNFFHLFANNPDSIVYGTDTLAPGSKLHGDAAYAINARIMEPMNVLFQELGAYEPNFSAIVSKINRENFDAIFNDPDRSARMDAYADWAQKEMPYDWSNATHPHVFTKPLVPPEPGSMSADRSGAIRPTDSDDSTAPERAKRPHEAVAASSSNVWPSAASLRQRPNSS